MYINLHYLLFYNKIYIHLLNKYIGMNVMNGAQSALPQSHFNSLLVVELNNTYRNCLK